MMKQLSGPRVLLVLLCGVFVACGGNPGKVEVEQNANPGQEQPQVKPAADKPDFRLTAMELLAVYKQDRQATGAKYHGKTLELSGQVSFCGYDLGKRKAQLNLKGADFLEQVVCYLRNEKEPWAKAVPGQEVVIRGRYEESIIPMLQDTVLVTTGPYQGVVLTSEQLAGELTKAPTGARERYKNKYLAVTGVILAREVNDLGDFSLYLQGNDHLSVRCSFEVVARSLVNKFIPGDRIKLVGKYDPIFADPGEFMLKYCMPVLSESSQPGSATQAPAVTLQDIKNRNKADKTDGAQAADQLKKAGVKVTQPFNGAWQVQLTNRHFNADGTLKPEVAQALARLPRIYELYLFDTPINGAGMAELQSLKATERLFLQKHKLTDAGLAPLAGMSNLTHLELNNHLGDDVTLGDAGLAHLQGLTGLKKLSLCHGRVTDLGLAHLKDLRALEILYLAGNPIKGPGLMHLRGLPKLMTLSLDGCPLTDAAAPHLAALPNLLDLLAEGSALTDVGVKSLAAALKLQMLRLSGTKITDQALPALAAIKTLRHLDLSRTQITDAALEALATMPALSVITLTDCPRLTPQGIAKLKKAAPKLRVYGQ